MLKNVFTCKIGADAAENELHLADIIINNCKLWHTVGILSPRRKTMDHHEAFDAARAAARSGTECAEPRGSTSPAAHEILSTCRQHVARFRLYRHRSLQENTRSSAFFKIYQII